MACFFYTVVAFIRSYGAYAMAFSLCLVYFLVPSVNAYVNGSPARPEYRAWSGFSSWSRTGWRPATSRRWPRWRR